MGEFEEISIKDFAKLRHLSESTVRRLMREGALPFAKYGRIYRIKVNAQVTEPAERFPKVFKSEADFCAFIDAI